MQFIRDRRSLSNGRVKDRLWYGVLSWEKVIPARSSAKAG